jgi:peptide/nickel transport system permease protein
MSVTTTSMPSTPAAAPEPVPMEPVQLDRPDRASRSFARQAIIDTWSRAGAKVGLAWIVVLLIFAIFAPFIANSHPILMKTADGSISSPLLQHLTSADAILLILAATFVVLTVVRGLRPSTRAVLFFWVLALAIPLTSWAIVKDQFPQWKAHDRRLWIFIGLGALAAIDLAVLVIVPLKARLSRRQWMWVLAPIALLTILLIAFPVRPPVTVWYERYRTQQAEGKILWATRTIVPYSPRDRNRDAPAGEHPAHPSARHWLGTERNGADMLSQMIHASRIALSVGFVATGIAAVIGIVIGGLMGYFAGTVDLLGFRLIEIFQAIPRLMLLLAIASLVSSNIYVLMVVIGLTGWTFDARLIRAEFLKLRKQDFVQAAIANGLPLRSILFRHMLPNGITPVLINSSFSVAAAILLESTLSFLGLGDPDQPSWGQLLNQARSGGAGFHWWIAIFPGLAIFLTVFAYNLIGEAIRDAIDPKLRKRD